ncbi:cupin [Paenibacillus sp. L3-i20]|uniref:cupin n=1 Tax=Paenibacillus sp. L3-i20 TaxID=2905833 RepID=UPI001EDD3267|nr:cupin [Paenibacillus sp. L3-i20]GKU79177.1 hypothetical protein L3i20_v235740 [Paenibacillus sp. L3-i20]
MKIYDFGKESGQNIISYKSSGADYTKIVKHNKQIQIGCIYIGQEGIVGLHKAPVNQLMLVVSGQGWVSGEEGIRYKIMPGQAAFWQRGECHESGSHTGMTVIVIESEDLEPTMKEIDWDKSVANEKQPF